MPVEPAEASQRAELARKQANFDIVLFEKNLPKEGKIGRESILHTQSEALATLQKDVAHTATVGNDESDDEDEEDNVFSTSNVGKLGFATKLTTQYHKSITEQLPRERLLAKGRLDLRDDFVTKIHDAAEYYARHPDATGPGFPFQALNPENQTLTRKGIVDFTQFQTLYETDAEALFREIKIRVLMTVAYEQQVRELYEIVAKYGHNQEVVHQWGDYLCQVIEAQDELVQNTDASTAAAVVAAELEEQLDIVRQGLEQTDRRYKKAAEEVAQLKNVNNRLKAELEESQLDLRESQVMLETLHRNAADASATEELQRQLDENAATITELRNQVKESKNKVLDRDETISRLQATLADMVVGQRNTTPLSETSLTSSARAAKSTKFDAPPLWHAKPSEDTVKFHVWYRQMQNKMEANADHFPDDRAKCMYVQSRLAGNAADALEPYLREDHPDGLTTYDSLMQHLWDEYNDPNRAEDARREFLKLTYKPGDNFHKFKNDFVRLAGEIRKPKSEWKYEFKEKLSASLQIGANYAYMNPAVEFNEYVRHCSEMARNLDNARQAKESRNKEKAGAVPNNNGGRSRRDNRNNGGSSRNKNQPGTTTGDSSSGKLLPRPTTEERIKLMNEGRCFTCREKGHTSSDCPRKAEAEKEREARIQAIAKRYEQQEDSSNKERLNTDSEDEGSKNE